MTFWSAKCLHRTCFERFSRHPNSTNSLVFVLEKRKPGLEPRTVRVGFVVDQEALDTGFSPSTSVLPCQYDHTNAPYSSSSTCCCYQKDKRAKPGNLPKCNALLEIWEQCIERTCIKPVKGSMQSLGNTLKCALYRHLQLIQSE